MERLVLKKTQSTLGVDFDPARGRLEMRGESYPENSLKFFQPLLDWLDGYLGSLGRDDEVRVDLDIIYFNSSSSKALMNFFERLEEAARQGVSVNVLWRYHEENEIAFECGEEFGEELEATGFLMLAYAEDAVAGNAGA